MVKKKRNFVIHVERYLITSLLWSHMKGSTQAFYPTNA